jgi:hypothetical protein
VWTYLSTWILQDGELPELRRGSRLTGYGIRASGWRLELTEHPDGLELVDGPDPDGYRTVTYVLTGLVELCRPETSEWIVRSGPSRFLVRLGEVPATPIDGEQVSVRCFLALVPNYEWSAFGLPDVRRDWTVDALKIEHRARDATGHLGDVVEVQQLTEMHKWADERPNLGSSYLLDLSPGNRSD